jgi:hypothetical protein
MCGMLNHQTLYPWLFLLNKIPTFPKKKGKLGKICTVRLCVMNSCMHSMKREPPASSRYSHLIDPSGRTAGAPHRIRNSAGESCLLHRTSASVSSPGTYVVTRSSRTTELGGPGPGDIIIPRLADMFLLQFVWPIRLSCFQSALTVRYAAGVAEKLAQWYSSCGVPPSERPKPNQIEPSFFNTGHDSTRHIVIASGTCHFHSYLLVPCTLLTSGSKTIYLQWNCTLKHVYNSGYMHY